MVLGVVGEERDPGVAVERLPTPGRMPRATRPPPRSRSSRHLQSGQQPFADPVACPAAHDQDDVAGADFLGQRGPRSPPPSPGRGPGAPAGAPRSPPPGRAAEAIVVSGIAPGPDVGDRHRIGARRGRRRTGPASRRSGGRSAARRRPRRAGPVRAGERPRGSRGSPSGGARSRHRPRRRPPRPSRSRRRPMPANVARCVAMSAGRDAQDRGGARDGQRVRRVVPAGGRRAASSAARQAGRARGAPRSCPSGSLAVTRPSSAVAGPSCRREAVGDRPGVAAQPLRRLIDQGVGQDRAAPVGQPVEDGLDARVADVGHDRRATRRAAQPRLEGRRRPPPGRRRRRGGPTRRW